MLHRLSIRDFVIVDTLELEFCSGFGALTGETGAGKSILLDALGLALGDRAEVGVVRQGRERADIAAEFVLSHSADVEAWCAEQAIPFEEQSLLLRRVIDANGRSRAWINGVPATLTQLREVGELLCDIHGQHAHHALLRNDAQRMLLDTYAGALDAAAEVARCYRAWKAAEEVARRADADAAELSERRELLAWQIEELQKLEFDPEQWAELNAEHARLAHASGLMLGADQALETLGEGEVTVAAMLRGVEAKLAGLVEIDPALQEMADLIASAGIQVDEALHGLRRYRDRLDLDPERLADIEHYMARVTDLARKHRVAVEELPALLQRWQQEAAQLSERADPELLARQVEETWRAYQVAAEQLSALRRPVAQQLSTQVTEAMQTLAMAGGRFEIALTPQEGANVHGAESVEFLVAANPSQALRPLAKVASGGELSRIGLAIQVMTSRQSAVETLIFDEVDVGIGGGVAEIVGNLLQRLGQSRQVLCVTHLPQVAARADWQWNIAKSQNAEGETLSVVTPLDDGGRIDEIARMLGGVQITTTTRRHAAEMLGVAPASE